MTNSAVTETVRDLQDDVLDSLRRAALHLQESAAGIAEYVENNRLTGSFANRQHAMWRVEEAVKHATDVRDALSALDALDMLRRDFRAEARRQQNGGKEAV